MAKIKISRSTIQHAYTIACDYIHEHPLYNEKKCFLHYSFLIVDDRIHTWATNNRITPDKKWGYEKLRRWDDAYVPGTHSELGVIQKCFNFLKHEVYKWSIINIRLNRKRELRLSAPCFVCRGWLKVLGCEKIIFSIENGWSEILDMEKL